MIKIKKGLDLPIEGEPKQELKPCLPVKSVAVLGSDYIGMKPSFAVKEGDQVKLGQELFADKKNPGVIFTSPVCGKIVKINRGEKRVLQSVEIQIDHDGTGGDPERELTFQSYEAGQISGLAREDIKKNLVDSGLWTAFRTRPFSRIPGIGDEPAAIFVNVMDTNPLSVYPGAVVGSYLKDFSVGVEVLCHLTAGMVHVCHDSHTHLPQLPHKRIKYSEFSGPHPAGLVGTHIHHLEPVHEKKQIWHISYQDVIALGKLFLTGKIWAERVVALGGPEMRDPSLCLAPLGASTSDLIGQDYAQRVDLRIVSGSLFSGHKASGAFAFLGRYHTQIAVLREGTEREFLGWQMPGFDKFSIKNVFFSKLLPGGCKFAMTTSTHGSVRAMVPVLAYEKVMPLDVEATFLLRSLLSQDTDEAALLGALELDEEDLGLCTFVCPGKVEYGPLLRQVLTTIEKEG